MLKKILIGFVLAVVLLYLINHFVFDFFNAFMRPFGCGQKYVNEKLVSVNLGGFWQSAPVDLNQPYNLRSIEKSLKLTGKYDVETNESTHEVNFNNDGQNIVLGSPGIVFSDYRGNAIRLEKNSRNKWNILFAASKEKDCSIPDYWLTRPFVKMINDMPLSFFQRRELINQIDVGKTSTARLF